MRTGAWQSVKTFVLVLEGCRRDISNPVHPHNVDAIEIIGMPCRHRLLIGPMGGEEIVGYCFDELVLPGDEDELVTISNILEGSS